MTTIQKTQRLNVVDALRGFAVAAILIVHFVEHFIYNVYPESTSEVINTLNQGVYDTIFFIFAGKSYTIFALLFGFTFIIQQRNEERKGRDFGLRFAWRLIMLTLFATINSLCFPGGDVLMLYAITGFAMIPFRKCSIKTLLIVSTIFLIQPIEILKCFNPNIIPTTLDGSYYPILSETITGGSFWEMIKINATLGQKASLLWAVDAGRLLQAPGLFIIGMILARGEYFRENIEFWIKTLLISLLASSILFIAKNTATDALLTLLTMWYNISFTAILVSIFVILYQHDIFQRLTDGLRYYGRMSLTNYISQSIIGSVIFFPYALGGAEKLGAASSAVIGLAIIALQVQFCKWWLSNHKQGPFEALWHRLTWGKSR